jgi:hypothetical protein
MFMFTGHQPIMDKSDMNRIHSTIQVLARCTCKERERETEFQKHFFYILEAEDICCLISIYNF